MTRASAMASAPFSPTSSSGRRVPLAPRSSAGKRFVEASFTSRAMTVVSPPSGWGAVAMTVSEPPSTMSRAEPSWSRVAYARSL